MKLPAPHKFTKPAIGEWPTIHKHPDGGYVWTYCPDCGSDVPVEEDGCCSACGRDALWYGVEAFSADSLPGDTAPCESCGEPGESRGSTGIVACDECWRQYGEDHEVREMADEED